MVLLRKRKNRRLSLKGSRISHLKDIGWVFAVYIAYVLMGGACFMAIERPLEKKTCQMVEEKLRKAHDGTV
jgi:hypothetical protein